MALSRTHSQDVAKPEPEHRPTDIPGYEVWGWLTRQMLTLRPTKPQRMKSIPGPANSQRPRPWPGGGATVRDRLGLGTLH